MGPVAPVTLRRRLPAPAGGTAGPVTNPVVYAPAWLVRPQCVVGTVPTSGPVTTTVLLARAVPGTNASPAETTTTEMSADSESFRTDVPFPSETTPLSRRPVYHRPTPARAKRTPRS